MARVMDTEELWPQGIQQGQEEQLGRFQEKRVEDNEIDGCSGWRF
jgi:hypothetical protein